MRLRINEQYCISSDANQWILQKVRTRKGVEDWESISFHSAIDDLIPDLGHRMVRESDATILARGIGGDRQRHHHALPGAHHPKRDAERSKSREDER